MYFEGEGVCVCVFICVIESPSMYLFVSLRVWELGLVCLFVIESPSIYLFVSLRVWELGLVCLFVSLRVHLCICLCL